MALSLNCILTFKQIHFGIKLQINVSFTASCYANFVNFEIILSNHLSDTFAKNHYFKRVFQTVFSLSFNIQSCECLLRLGNTNKHHFLSTKPNR